MKCAIAMFHYFICSDVAHAIYFAWVVFSVQRNAGESARGEEVNFCLTVQNRCEIFKLGFYIIRMLK